jgi:hypothetical protein
MLALMAVAATPMMRADLTERPLPLSAPASAIDLFRQVCYDPFPSADRADAAIAARGGFTAWQPASDMERQIQASLPSRIWFSQSATVRFIARGAASPDRPDPQCSVMAAVSVDQPPEELFSQLATELRLPAGKLRGKTRYRTSMWDLARPEGQRWRIIFGTQRESDGLHLRLSMLNLVPEARQ